MKNYLKKPNIERLLTTMKGGVADRVPFYEILLEARNVKALLGKDVGTTKKAPSSFRFALSSFDSTVFCFFFISNLVFATSQAR
jgi:hypothetical protein